MFKCTCALPSLDILSRCIFKPCNLTNNICKQWPLGSKSCIPSLFQDDRSNNDSKATSSCIHLNLTFLFDGLHTCRYAYYFRIYSHSYWFNMINAIHTLSASNRSMICTTRTKQSPSVWRPCMSLNMKSYVFSGI